MEFVPSTIDIFLEDMDLHILQLHYYSNQKVFMEMELSLNSDKRKIISLFVFDRLSKELELKTTDLILRHFLIYTLNHINLLILL